MGAAPRTPPTQEEQEQAEQENITAELKARSEEWVRTESREREGMFYWWNPVTGAAQHSMPNEILDYQQHLSYSTQAVPKAAQPRAQSSELEEPSSEMGKEYDEFLEWKRFQEMRSRGQRSQSSQ